MKQYQFSSISKQIIIFIILSAVQTEIAYAITNGRLFYEVAIVTQWIQHQYYLVGLSLVTCLSMFRYWKFSWIVFCTYLVVFFIQAVYDLQRYQEKVLFGVMVPVLMVGIVMAFLYSLDIKAAYRRGLIGASNLVLAPKLSIRVIVQLLNGEKEELHGVLSNWDIRSGYFHSFTGSFKTLGPAQIIVEFSGRKFVTRGRVVNVNRLEGGNGFVVDNDLSSSPGSWHTLVNLLGDLGFSAALII